MMKRRVLLGSLCVNYEVWLPYAAGCLQAYALRDSTIAGRFSFHDPIYRSTAPQLDEILCNTDILGLTCYVWNQTANDNLARRYRRLNPQGFVVYGGPNIPREVDLQMTVAAERPEVDLFFVGPGEEIFRQFLRGFDEKARHEHPGTFGLWDGVFFSLQTDVRRQISGEELPDPYTLGIFAKTLATEPRVKCSFETNRGCPFKCAFCDWGGTSNSKVTKFEPANIYKILDYIYAQPTVAEIEILDANFGMQKRDLDVVEYMAKLNREAGRSPKVSYSGLVKNGSDYLVPILRKIHFELGAEQRNLKISFQTHSKETLKVIQRDNIRNERLIPMIEELRKDGLAVTSEMIIGLPGETADSWLATLERDYELKIDYMRTYFLHLTCNTDMYTRAYREQYQVKSKRLRFPSRYVGLGYKDVWSGTKVGAIDDQYEEHEIVYQCHSFNQNEIVRMFDYWWFYQNFLNSRALKFVIDELVERGVSLSDQIKAYFEWLPASGYFYSLLEKSRATVRQLYAPEDVTEIDDLSTYFFYSRCLRRDEVHHFWRHQDLFFTEIEKFLAQWIPDGEERVELLNLQRASWRTHNEASDWRTVRTFFGTDARILNEVAL